MYGNYLTRSYKDEVPHPTTMHHKSKLAAEAIVMRSSSKKFNFKNRLAFGEQRDDDFVAKIIKVLRNSSQPIISNPFQRGVLLTRGT